MYHIHHLNKSRSQRIIWLLEAVGAQYQIHVYQRDAHTNLAPPALSNIHPLGRAPLLVHDEVVIAESGAICDYVARQHPESGFLPSADSDDFNQVQFWSHYAEGSFMPSLVTSMVLEKARAKAKPFFIRMIAGKIIDGVMSAYFGKNITQNLAFVEAELDGKNYLVGNSFTLADIQMSFGLEALYDAGKLSNHPNMCKYVENIRQSTTHQIAMQKMAQAESKALVS